MVDIEKASLCNVQEKYSFFPDSYTHKEGSKICHIFGGQLVDVSTKEKFQRVVNFLGFVREDPAWTKGLYVSSFSKFTDEEEYNVWKDYVTGEKPKDALLWHFGEPNGGMNENCAQIWTRKDDSGKWVGSFNDRNCNRPLAVACEGVGKVLLTLRGLF